jgi:hypothetical protein
VRTKILSIGPLGASGARCANCRLRSLVCIGLVASATLSTPCVAQEAPAEIIAAHVRRQGFACEHAIKAERDNRASKPNEAVWTLQCSNSAYLVRLIPDMAAIVERIK